MQIREKWVNTMDPELSRDEWAPEEDALLETAVSRYGQGRWSKVAEDVSSLAIRPSSIPFFF